MVFMRLDFFQIFIIFEFLLFYEMQCQPNSVRSVRRVPTRSEIICRALMQQKTISRESFKRYRCDHYRRTTSVMRNMRTREYEVLKSGKTRRKSPITRSNYSRISNRTKFLKQLFKRYRARKVYYSRRNKQKN